MPIMTDDSAVTEDAADEGATGTDTDALESDEAQSDEAQSDEAQSDEAQSDEAQSDEAQSDEVAEPKRRLPSPRVVAAVAAIGGLLAGTGVFGWQVWQARQIEHAGQEAQRTAVSYAQVLTSIDSNNVDENFKQVLDGATGEFKDMYSQSSVELRQLLIENKATAHGVVIDSAVQSVSKDRAVVLLFVDQSVANTKLPDPRIDRSRMKMTLEKVDGRWRASKVELP
jgi:Mce-associated membrane protein